MLFTILQALYFFFPAYVANMFPVFASWLQFPGGVSISEKRLGSHKTYRGVVAGVIGALLITALQYFFLRWDFFVNLSLLDYENWLILGFLFGFGALLGDMVKSFFKRRLHKKAGTLWFPFDQLDFVVGALVFVAIFYIPPFSIIILLFILTPFLHFLTNVIAYLLGMKKVWW